MRNAELLPAFCLGFAISAAYLRWIMLTQWSCRRCGDKHIRCACKPDWVKKLL